MSINTIQELLRHNPINVDTLVSAMKVIINRLNIQFLDRLVLQRYSEIGEEALEKIAAFTELGDKISKLKNNEQLKLDAIKGIGNIIKLCESTTIPIDQLKKVLSIYIPALSSQISSPNNVISPQEPANNYIVMKVFRCIWNYIVDAYNKFYNLFFGSQNDLNGKTKQSQNKQCFNKVSAELSQLAKKRKDEIGEGLSKQIGEFIALGDKVSMLENNPTLYGHYTEHLKELLAKKIISVDAISILLEDMISSLHKQLLQCLAEQRKGAIGEGLSQQIADLIALVNKVSMLENNPTFYRNDIKKLNKLLAQKIIPVHMMSIQLNKIISSLEKELELNTNAPSLL